MGVHDVKTVNVVLVGFLAALFKQYKERIVQFSVKRMCQNKLHSYGMTPLSKSHYVGVDCLRQVKYYARAH